MRILPKERLVLLTDLTPEEAVCALQGEVEPRRRLWTWPSAGHRVFQGEVESQGFNISRIIHYRNSFLPMIAGEFRADVGGTRIDVSMRLHPIVAALTAFWFGALGVILLLIVAGLIAGEEDHFLLGLLVTAGLIAFGCAISTLPFQYEAAKATKELLRILEARKEDAQK